MAGSVEPTVTLNSSEDARPSRRQSIYRRVIDQFLHCRILIKAQILLGFVVVGSAIQAFFEVPDTFFSDKTNPINQYFVKLSWLWTLTCVVPTVLISAIYSCNLWDGAVGHFGRVSIGHGVWFCVTSLIELLDNTVGVCTDESISSAKACVRGGHEWTGFDISGHVFLLSYCIFVISEEAVIFKPENKLTPKSNAQRFLTTNFVATTLEVYSFILTLIWTVMIVATSFYFHTFLEKLVGCVVAVAVWWITYQYVYGKSRYLPKRPGVDVSGCRRTRKKKPSVSKREGFNAGSSILIRRQLSAGKT